MSWITFEGVEGSGKTTQINRLAEDLRSAGIDPVLTREPGGTALGNRLRELLLRPVGSPMDPMTELLLYTADRAQHLVETVLPALAEGRPVLCDRYLDATLAYQGHGRGLDRTVILELHRRPPLDRRPTRTVLFDLDAGIALRRARERNRDADLDDTEGRFERETLEFHRRVRRGYLELAAAEPDRFRTIDADADVETIAQQVRHALRDLFPTLDDPR